METQECAWEGSFSLPSQSSFPFFLLRSTTKLRNLHNYTLIQIQVHDFIRICLLSVQMEILNEQQLPIAALNTANTFS